METPNSNTLGSHMLHLERLLGRQWSNEDFSRTMERLHRVSAGTTTIDAEVDLEVSHLGGGSGLAPEASDQLAAVLPKYYALLLQAWPVITERRSPAPPVTLDDSDFPNLSVVAPPPTISDDEDVDEDYDDLVEGDNEGDYTIVYYPDEVDDKVSAEDTLSMSNCKTEHYPDEDVDEADDQDVDNCTICLDRLQRGLVAILDCTHAFHGDCIVTWVVRGRNFCPLCKAKALR